jgi:hypothetical protein
MTDLGNRNASMRLQCKHCGWVPPEGMTIGDAQLHFQVDHDTDEVKFDLVAVCTCGEAMTHTTSKPTGGGFKDYLVCGVCGNTGFVKRDA